MKKKEFLPWKTVTVAVFTTSLMFAWIPLMAQEDLEKPPEIPQEAVKEGPLPPKVQDEQLEPTVTIREEEDRHGHGFPRSEGA